MVSALLSDALADPTAVLCSLHIPHSSSELPIRGASHFRHIFHRDDAFNQIPALDVHSPPQSYANQSRPLVRFRAMVQDTSPSPEVYLATLPDGKPGAWGLSDTTHTEAALDMRLLRERDVLWAVSIPGESPFVSEYLDDPDSPKSLLDILPNPLRDKDPLARPNSLCVQIKIYDTTAASLKPTELRTFVGFLTSEHPSSIDDTAAEDAPVPTLHVIFSVDHPLSLLRVSYPATPPVSASDVSLPTVRDELIRWLAEEALGGDIDAAEWVLIASIARVQSRQPPLLPPSLTLSRFPKPEADSTHPTLIYVLRQILPLFVDVTLSLPLLNTRTFAPESHNESLRSGMLQLPSGTTVLLSDSGVQEGNINETGVKNIQALQTSLAAQTLDYHFPYTAPYQFPTDLSFLVLTNGKHCALAQTNLVVPLVCKAPQNCFKSSENVRLPSPTQLDAYRRLVGGAKIGKLHVTEEVSQYIQDNFVGERQANKAVSADDLMTRMAVARLMALSRHDAELSKEVWHRAKELDERRKLRSLTA